MVNASSEKNLDSKVCFTDPIDILRQWLGLLDRSGFCTNQQDLPE